MRIKFGVKVKIQRAYFRRMRSTPDSRYSTSSRSLKMRINSLLRGTEYPIKYSLFIRFTAGKYFPIMSMTILATVRRVFDFPHLSDFESYTSNSKLGIYNVKKCTLNFSKNKYLRMLNFMFFQ